ncbi:16471_t:CDS:1, partial [Gigaspora margarita]
LPQCSSYAKELSSKLSDSKTKEQAQKLEIRTGALPTAGT